MTSDNLGAVSQMAYPTIIPAGLVEQQNNHRKKMCRSSVIGRKKVVKPNYPYFCSRNTELMQIACRPPTEPKAQSSWNGWSSQSSV